VREERKTKKELIEDLLSVRRRLAKLEESQLERGSIERSLQDGEEMFRNLAEQSPNMIFINQRGRIVFANDKCQEVMGYTKEEFCSPDFDYLDIIGADSIELVKASFARHMKGEEVEPYEYSLVTREGKVIKAIITTKLIDYGDDQAILGIVTDVTARKSAEEALRKSEERYRKLVENASVGIVVVQDNAVKFVNPRILEMTGFTEKEILSTPFIEFIHPGDRKMVIEYHRKRMSGEPVPESYEVRVFGTDGEIQWLEIAGVGIDWENGTGSLNFVLDITERKKSELEKRDLREKLNNAQRMEAIGVLAGGVAHDLNNILGPLVAYPQMVRMSLEPDNPINGTLAKIEDSAQRAAGIVQDLLSLARRGRYELVPMDLNELINSIVNSKEYSQYMTDYPGVRLQLRLDDSIPKSYGSSTHLVKAIMNLIVNALDAMPDGGELRIETECKHVDRLAGGFANIESGKYNIITVGDTGVGINEKDILRIFEPFYTRKKLGREGSGLGLAIVYGVVKDHNGYVDVSSKPRQGTAFHIYLPVAEVTIEGDKRIELSDIRGNETILVVDDVAEQRELAATILSSLGYRVHTAASGEEATEYCRSNKPDMVIVDMVMDPGIDGLDTYRRIIKIHPGQKAIISTGFSETDRVREAKRLGVGKVIRKPYTMQMLGKAIRELLREEATISEGRQPEPAEHKATVK
jgi:PAS domain S-box-containing protein